MLEKARREAGRSILRAKSPPNPTISGLQKAGLLSPLETKAMNSLNALPTAAASQPAPAPHPSLSPQEKLCLQLMRLIRRNRHTKFFTVPPRQANCETKQEAAINASPLTQAGVLLPRFPHPLSRTPRWTGALAELKFAWRGMELGLATLFPWNDFLPFDVIVVTARHVYRVQVKFVGSHIGPSHSVGLRRTNGGRYREGEFDFLAVLTSDDVWYIVPFEAIKGRREISLPRENIRSRNRPRFLRFRERWDLFI